MSAIRLPLLLAITAALVLTGVEGRAGLTDMFQNVDKAMKGAKIGRDVTDALRPFSLEEEVALGVSISERVVGRYGLLENADVNHYITKVGRLCAANATRKGGPDYYFTVLDSENVNAFAAPGGFIFITMGALREMENEAQLAGALSHEIAHVDKLHILKGISSSQLRSSLLDAMATGGVINGNLRSAIADAGAETLFSKGYERKDEDEADREGTAMAYRSGYPADGLLSFISRLPSREDNSAWNNLKASHKDRTKRLTQLEEEIASSGYESGSRPYLSERFTRNVK